jgi:hypothetical protein
VASATACGCSEQRRAAAQHLPPLGNQPQMNSLIDIEKFVAAIADATRTAFNTLVQSSSKESIYGFCLYTVDDLAGIVPSASADAGFKQRKEKVLADQKQIAWLKEVNIDVNRCILGDQRWSAYEWEFDTDGGTAFTDADKMLEDFVANVEKSKGSFAQLTAEVLASLTIALHRLRSEDLFDREKTTVFCSKPSSFDTAWLESESARVLNSPSQYATFARERIEWIREDGDDRQEALPLYRKIVSRYCKAK